MSTSDGSLWSHDRAVVRPVSVEARWSLSLVRSVSESALQQAVAAAAGRALVLPAEPVHHVTGVSSVTAAQAEVGGASDGHVTDGALEGEPLTDGALSPSSLTATVTAVHAKLDAFVRFRRT